MSLAKFQSHKVVSAGKINEIYSDSHIGVEQSDGSNFTTEIPANFFARGTANPGDYYVVYDDGYASWSPAKAFEDGYKRIDG